MKIILLYLCATFGLNTGQFTRFRSNCEVPADSQPDLRIVGGLQVQFANVPYQAFLQYSDRHTCGGSIISSEWILTAAHCLGDLNSALYSLRVGSSDHTKGGVLVNVKSVKPHPEYDNNNLDFDFALLELEKRLVFGSSVQPIDLPEDFEELEEGALCTVSGWGQTENGKNAPIPQFIRAANVPSIRRKQCARMLNISLTEQMLCAGYTAGGTGSCVGDSGGPLVSDGKLFGVVSWSVGCALANKPGVYARVSSVRDWIRRVANV